MLRSRVFLFAKSLIVALAILDGSLSFQISTPFTKQSSRNAGLQTSLRQPTSALHVFKTQEDETTPDTSVEDTTEKYGLEAGLFQSLKSDDSGASAKSLLAKYGVAYLATSIPLALVSFTLCYFLVDNGVDMGSLLSKVGIEAGDSGEKAGTFAIAYAAHKAASPIRFPPTVLLTPVVAKIIGKEPNEEVEGEESD
mmetsp:Transcript_7801/g.11738  ORF Transcript_7801/g.11738 Transcript_7801/m.11738 type:complete len:196 (+) Transcript_7801:98-685(+)